MILLGKYILLIIIGLAGAFSVAGGAFSFVTMIGVIPRLAAKTKTIKYMQHYETAVILGGVLSNFMFVFQMRVPLGAIGLIVYGGFTGAYVGCLSIAIAEVLNVIPIIAQRARLQIGISIIVVAFGLGKGFGAFYQLWWNR
ncbi:stage V sporulation protein AB [Lachnospiraceae bacterium KM106-2]|nr:stage V sporulation protein AB [Lachnospiraceae bacterium KM106-2]